MFHLWNWKWLFWHSSTRLWNAHLTGTQPGQLPIFLYVSHQQRWNRAHGPGVIRLENVPGTLLGILSCWWLFPETIRGPAELKHTHTYAHTHAHKHSRTAVFHSLPAAVNLRLSRKIQRFFISFFNIQRLYEEEGSRWRTQMRMRMAWLWGQMLNVSCDGDSVPYHEKEELCKTIKTPWMRERESVYPSGLMLATYSILLYCSLYFLVSISFGNAPE